MRLLCLTIFLISALASSFAEAAGDQPQIQEEVWAIPVTLPTIAYVVRPVGSGPFPLVEFRDAAMWFARKGYMVVAPTGSGYGAAALDAPERGLFTSFYSKIGRCENPNFRDAGLAVALLDKWIIEYMAEQKRILPDNVIVVGQSAGGWAAIALSSQNLPAVHAVIAFAAGRGGRVGGKANNNCAPDKLVLATGEFGRSARVPMLWIYSENDTFFGPALSKRMHEAYVGAGGKAEYHMLPPFGNDGHFLIGSADAIPLWAPLVDAFLEKIR